MRKLIVPIAAVVILASDPAFAADEEIYGTYRLISTYQRILDTGAYDCMRCLLLPRCSNSRNCASAPSIC
jgi:hypothetical protein